MDGDGERRGGGFWKLSSELGRTNCRGEGVASEVRGSTRSTRESRLWLRLLRANRAKNNVYRAFLERQAKDSLQSGGGSYGWPLTFTGTELSAGTAVPSTPLKLFPQQ